MATIWVKYKNGDTDEWELHEAMDLGDLVKLLARATASKGSASFGVASKSGGSADYGFVGLAMPEIASWHVDGMVDVPSAAALWAEMESFPEDEPPGPGPT